MLPNGKSLALWHAIFIAADNEIFRIDEFSSQKIAAFILIMRFLVKQSCTFFNFQILMFHFLMRSLNTLIALMKMKGSQLSVSVKGVSLMKKCLLAAKVGNFWSSSTTQNNHGFYEEAQVDVGEISYHIVQVIPTNRDLLDETTVKVSALKDKKFDVSVIENSTIV